MVKVIHADNFLPAEDVDKLFAIATSLKFEQGEYGQEVKNFNLVQPGMEPVFSRVLGETVCVDEETSGVFRRTMNCIHFEGFDSLNEWCFIVALENHVSFNIYKHKSGADSALVNHRFNYRNLFEWDYYCNFELNKNQGVFFRPWLFHSINNGVVQYYKLKGTAHDTS